MPVDAVSAFVYCSLPAAPNTANPGHKARRIQTKYLWWDVTSVRVKTESCGRPQASGYAHRDHLGRAHLGLSDDLSPPCVRYRPWRKYFSRWRTLGRLPAGLLSARAGPLSAVPAVVPRETQRRLPCRHTPVLRSTPGACRSRSLHQVAQSPMAK